MTLTNFIKTNKGRIDNAIRTILRKPEYPLNNAERRLWILNDENLYRWAQSEGVKI